MGMEIIVHFIVYFRVTGEWILVMVKRCPQCDQVLLEDEFVCWQCGRRLAEAPAGTSPPPPAPSPVFSLSPIHIYPIILALLIAMSLWLTAALSSQPLVQANTTDRPPAGWFVFTSDDRQFTLFLPESWSRYEANTTTLSMVIAADPFYEEVTQTLGHDWQMRLLVVPHEAVMATRPEAFLLVAYNPSLVSLSLAEAQQDMESRPGILDTNLIDNFNKSHLLINWTTSDSNWSCQQQFFSAGFLVNGCSPNPSPHKANLNLMQTHFQPLQP